MGRTDVNKLKKAALHSVAKVGKAVMTNPSFQRILFNAIRLDRAEVAPLIRDRKMQFISYCLGRREQSRSQILQDLWVCFELNEKRSGYFVEFGATNGLKNSNTWLLEKQYGWTGILAEPNPFWHTELTANRGADFEARCVSGRTGELVTFISTENSDPELSGIEEFSASDHFAATRQTGTKIEIETISLDDMLILYTAPKVIDYISVDTEGSELAIFEGFSFNYDFNLISVETNRQTDAIIQTLLESKGYMRVFPEFSQWDAWYVAKNVRSPSMQTIVAPDT
ncbi:MAG: Methyltransferase [Sphingomonadales bacterium]|nr:Methyltransferase [Sphingomonadales bacterium]